MANLIKTITTNPAYNKISSKLLITLQDLKKRFSDELFIIIVVNAALILFQLAYLRLRYIYLNDTVPFWYTKLWGDFQLAEKYMLFLIPATSFLILAFGLLATIPVKRYYMRYGINLIGLLTIGANLLLTFSLLRIIFIAAVPFEPFIEPLYLELLTPAVLAGIVTYFVLPRFITYAHDNDLVTNPNLHKHPGMILAEPSARGGGFVYGMVFLVLAVLFVGLPLQLLPFYVALFLISFLGILDDYQNTHPESKWKWLENPYIRLVLLFLIVSMISFLGTNIFFISNPLGGLFVFDNFWISAGVTTLWIVWFLNVLSWSNGIDGQYAGIVSIASVLIALLVLRFDPLELEQKRIAVLAAISVGVSFGFIKFTWHPSKVLWGFGAMSAGLVLAFLSLLSSAKIITSVIIVLIPFLDAFITAMRRLLQGKSPLKGDRGHLHHILLRRGWSVRKIAVFYWITTAVIGGIGFLSADRFTLQVGYILVGIVAFGIVLLNLRLSKDIIAPEDSLVADYTENDPEKS